MHDSNCTFVINHLCIVIDLIYHSNFDPKDPELDDIIINISPVPSRESAGLDGRYERYFKYPSEITRSDSDETITQEQVNDLIKYLNLIENNYLYSYSLFYMITIN